MIYGIESLLKINETGLPSQFCINHISNEIRYGTDCISARRFASEAILYWVQ